MENVFLVSIFILLCQTSFGQTKNFIDQPFIETTATVDTLVVPDEIYLTISITEKDTKGKISIEELESKMVTTLKQLEIDTEENLTLNDLSSNFKKYFLKSQDILKVKVYTLKVQDAVKAGEVILALERIEISNVLLDRTEYSKMDKLILKLKSRAIAKAKAQAEYLVKPLNQKIGAAIFISDNLNNNVDHQLQGRAQGVIIRGYSSINKKEFKPADIEFDNIPVQTSVTVKFKLEE